MIKEKHEKGSSDGVKEDAAGGSEKSSPSTEVRVKKEEDASASSAKKATTVKNGAAVIGSTNLGSMHPSDIKTEADDGPPASADAGNAPLKDEMDGELAADAFNMSGSMSSSSAPSAPPDGVQPLASNVINKQPSSMEVQYMQQQSQIFVFSTVMANAGADEVLQGRFPTIIAYHCSQPGTKKYLEKNPLKMAQFSRQNPGQWLNAMTKNKNCVRSPGLAPKAAPNLDFLVPDGLDDIGLGDGDLPWEQKNNHQLDALDGVANGLPDDMDACSPSLGGVQPSLQGVKVPDENLTPQQRQHREEQLATIRKLHQMLCSEEQALAAGPPGAPGGANPQGAVPAGGGGGAGAGGPSAGPAGSSAPPASESLDLQPGMMGGGQGGGSAAATMMHSPMEWQKMQQQQQQQYFDKQGKPLLRSGAPTAGPRLQGPPPPYHQTQRSASVPIALQSPNPASPNNPTSNLSLPSPSRASSALNSPADSTRPFGLSRHMSTGQSPTSQDSPSKLNHSNPGTPLSSHLSPSVATSASDAVTAHPNTADGMFGRALQSMAQQKQMITNPSVPSSGPNMSKEPNLMPVPSPQQIQYLNAFEGQELIIQKQPNTSLSKDGNMISPPILPSSIESGFPGSNDMPHNRLSGPNTPTSMDVGGRYPGTPSDGCRFQVPSPHTPGAGDKPSRHSGGPGLSPQTGGPSLGGDPSKNEMYPSPSPHMMDVPRFPGPSPSPSNKMGNFVNVSPSGKPPNPMVDMPNYGCGRGENVPLNPNCTSAMTGNPKVSHFDPISSLAQMSQQLTNSVATSLNGGQGGQGGPGGMMNFGSPSMHMMEMGGCHVMADLDPSSSNMLGMQMQGPPHGFHPNSPMGPIRSLSPKLQGAFSNHMPMPRMMGRPPGPNPYNGANVQVKPNAPNTIQYMPAKPQVGNAPGPRGPPSLEFLQRFANPMSSMDKQMSAQNMQYFPNNGPMPNPNGPLPGHMGAIDGPGPGMPDGPMGPMMAGPGPMGNGGAAMMGPNLGMPGNMMPMMRPMRPPPQGMMRMPPMGFNGPHTAGPGGDGMFNPGPPNMPNPNAQMFVNGPKGSPMGLCAPDASQPLPPSMGQSNNSFKNSPFVGPSTADPNYAQQFHHFQQQLYATGTRSQMGGQAMGPGPGPPHPQQPPFFNQKDE